MPEKENEKTLTQKVESLGTLITERMDKGDKGLETLSAEVAGVKVQLKKQEEWTAEIEDKVLAKELRNACKHGFREGAAYATEVLLRKQKK